MACEKGGCAAAVPSGSEAYAKLYPKQSSDGVLRLGNVVPGERTTLHQYCSIKVTKVQAHPVTEALRACKLIDPQND